MLVVTVAFGLAGAGLFDYMADRTVRDSLTRIHPRMRSHWLAERGFEDRRPLPAEGQNSTGLRCIGRWSYGPSYDVDGRVTPEETLVAQARGSGVSLIRFRRTDSVELELLSDINAQGLMHRVWVRDSLLYAGSAAGLEIWDIADERSPARLSWTPIPLNDFCVQESLAYVIGADDSFRVYSVADPESPYQVGVCRDSGYSVAVTGGTALIGDRWGLYLLDVSDPANPHRVNSWGSAIDAIATRGALACVTQYNPNQPGELTLRTFYVSDPPAVIPLGTLNGAGGYDIHLEDTLVFCSGDGNDHALKIVSIADSAHPRLLGVAATPGWGMGVWSNGVGKSAFYAAHFEGMEVYDVADATNPVRDTSFGRADMSVDIDVEDGLAAVATDKTGLVLLDVSDPSLPAQVSIHDTVGQRPFMESALLADSFAYVGWYSVPSFVSLDITDPAHPQRAGEAMITNPPEDMVLRDSLVYVAMWGGLQVVNVVRPREPEMIGSCGLLFHPRDMDLRDSIAYVATITSMQMVNVTDPTSPRVVGTWYKYTSGLDVEDTLAFTVGADYAVWALSVANPASPRVLDSVRIGYDAADVAVVDSVAYACGTAIHVVDASNPQDLRLVGQVSVPDWTSRLVWSVPYLYACCGEGGICVFETTHVGIRGDIGTRPGVQDIRPEPNPTSGIVGLPYMAGQRPELRVWDVTGKEVTGLRLRQSVDGKLEVDMTALPAGLYFLDLRSGKTRYVGKAVKR